MNYDVSFGLLKQVVRALGNTFGNRCEVVLHDLRQPEASIIAIANGEVTGREVGHPSTNFGLMVLKNPYGDFDSYNYRSQTKSGRVLKSSSIYFKDPGGRVFAALCINWDITDLIATSTSLAELILTTDTADESYETDIAELMRSLIDGALTLVNKPIAHMDKEDKLRVIEILEEKGVFQVKGSVDRVATKLGTSRATIYAYLSELQGRKENNVI